ncbi:MAG: glycosyltransferase family 4 protein [Aggregatilineales bacterium]
MRLPTEKAHGLQIMQNCEALANAGYEVELWASGRVTTPDMQQITDIHAYYGVDKNFRIRRLPVIDLYPIARGNTKIERIAFYVVLMTYLLMLIARLLTNRADIYYSRDEYLIYALSLFFPAQKLAYEAHLFASTERGTRLQKSVLDRTDHIITITARLKADFIQTYNIPEAKILVAHDGIRAARFDDVPVQSEARQQIGWRDDLFIVGFVGRLHMLNVDKGVGTLIEALSGLDGVAVALVGGPDEMVETFRQQWLTSGGSDDTFLYAGHVMPGDVPRYLSAFDVCVMPHPFTTQFAYYTSPLKLFEYMASKRAIVASDLPGWADILVHEQNALLIPASDDTALRAAMLRLRDNTELRQKIADVAYQDVMRGYTWAARAGHIRQHLEHEV